MSIARLFIIILVALVVLCAEVWAVVPPFTQLPLAWDRAPNHGTNIVYVLKWGNLPGSTNYSLNVGTNTTAIVTNPTAGYLYFHVIARTPEGLESDPSNTVIETNHPASPLILRFGTNKTTTSLRIEGTTDAQNWIHLATIERAGAPPTIQSASKSMMIRAVKLSPPLP